MTIADVLLILGALWAAGHLTAVGLRNNAEAEAAYRRPEEKGGRHGYQDD